MLPTVIPVTSSWIHLVTRFPRLPPLKIAPDEEAAALACYVNAILVKGVY